MSWSILANNLQKTVRTSWNDGYEAFFFLLHKMVFWQKHDFHRFISVENPLLIWNGRAELFSTQRRRGVLNADSKLISLNMNLVTYRDLKKKIHHSGTCTDVCQYSNDDSVKQRLLNVQSDGLAIHSCCKLIFIASWSEVKPMAAWKAGNQTKDRRCFGKWLAVM